MISDKKKIYRLQRAYTNPMATNEDNEEPLSERARGIILEYHGFT